MDVQARGRWCEGLRLERDGEVFEPPPAEDILGDVLGALTPEELQRRFRHLPAGVRSQLLSDLSEPSARPPKVHQCKAVLRKAAKATADLKAMMAWVLASNAVLDLVIRAKESPRPASSEAAWMQAHIMLEALLADHGETSVRLAVVALLTADAGEASSDPEVQAGLLRVLLTHEQLSLPAWQEWGELLSDPTSYGMERRIDQLAALYETMPAVCRDLADRFEAGDVVALETAELPATSAVLFDGLASELGEAIDSEPPASLSEMRAALAAWEQLHAPDPTEVALGRVMAATGSSEVVGEITTLAAQFGEDDDHASTRDALLALVKLHDAIQDDDEAATDDAEQALTTAAGDHAALLRKASRHLLRGLLKFPDDPRYDEKDLTDSGLTASSEPAPPAVAVEPASSEPSTAATAPDLDLGVEETDHLDPLTLTTIGTTEPPPDADHVVEPIVEDSVEAEEPHTGQEHPQPDVVQPDAMEAEGRHASVGAIGTDPPTDHVDNTASPAEVNVPAELSGEGSEAFGPQPGDLPDSSAMLAEALDRGRVGLAHWVAAAADAPSLAAALSCLAYAEAARSSTGPSVAEFRDQVGRISNDEVDNTAIRLLMAAAGLRMALIAPFAGPIDLLGKLGDHLDGLPKLTQLVAVFAEAAQRGVQVAGEITASLRDAAADDAALEALRKEAASLLEQGPHRTNKYQAATLIWAGWIEPSGMLGSLLQTVAKDERKKLDVCATSVLELRDRRELDREIQRRDRRTTARNRIIGPAKESLINWTFEVLDTVGAWVDLAQRLDDLEQASSSSSWQAGPLGELRTRAIALRQPVLAEIQNCTSDGDSFERAAAATAASCIDTTLGLLLDGKALDGLEQPAKLTLNQDLLLAHAVRLDDMEPRAQPQLDELWHAVQAPIDRIQALESAFTDRADRGDHDGSQVIVKLLEDLSPDSASKVRTQRQISVVKWSDRARRLMDETSQTLHSSHRHGYLTEDEWSEFSARMGASDPSDRSDFGILCEELQSIREELARAKEDAIAGFRTRFEEAKATLQDVEQASERIQARLDEGDLATAEEYLALATAGTELPETSSGPGIVRFENLHSGLASELAELKIDRRATNAVEKGGTWGPFTFGAMDQSTRTSAREAVALWASLSADKRPDKWWPAIAPVLKLLGLEVSDARSMRGLTGSKERQWLELSGVRRNGKAMVPDFGSHAGGVGVGGRLLLMVASGNPRPELVADWVGHERDHRPVMVWYLGCLSPADRRKLADLFRPASRRRPVIIVDSALLMYLVSVGGQNFESTMRLTLPLAAVNPYLPGVAGLVPPEMFYGRAEELRALLRPEGSSFVYGGRQLGKSALLLAAQRRFENGRDRFAIYLDLKGQQIGVRNGRPPDELWAVLWRALSEKGVVTGDPPGRDVAGKLESAIKGWLAADEGRSLLVLLDECDPLLEADGESGFTTVSRLKALMETERRRFKVVFAGLHRVQRYDRVENHPLAHLGSPIAIGPLRPQAAADLVAAPMEAMGYRFESPELVSRILAVCNNQPSLIVIFMKALVDRLLTRVLRDNQPPVIVTEEDVETTYLSEDLAEQIRYRFDLTLGLDPAYKVIAYTLALLCRTERLDIAVRESALRRQCAGWWPEGFGTIGNDAFRALCEEMVGLGVLARTPAGFRLRSPNILRLLGTTEQIEDTLLEAGQLERDEQYDPTTHRPLMGEGGDRRYSPLTAAQIADLLAPRNQVRVIIGSPANGSGSVLSILEQEAPERVRVTKRNATSSSATGAFSARGAAHHTAALIDLSGTDELRARAVLSQAVERRKGSVGVVLLAGIDQVPFWRYMVNTNTEDVSIVELVRASNETLRAVADGLDLPLAADSGREGLLEVTGGWWKLVNKVFVEIARGSSHTQAIEALAAELQHRDAATDFVSTTGVIADRRLSETFGSLVELQADGVDADFLAEVIAHNSSDEALTRAATDIEILRVLGALEPAPDGGLQVERVLSRVWPIVRR